MGYYRLYIDESGNHDLRSADSPNERFLGLTGVIVEVSHIVERIQPDMEQLKRKFFLYDPDSPFCFHRKDIIKRTKEFHVLNDHEKSMDFSSTLLTLLESWEYKVICVVIDKLVHREQYGVWHYHPYHYCLAVMLERYAMFLKQEKSRGDVMAEQRGGREDIKLKDSYERLFRTGSEYVSADLFSEVLTSKQLKVKPKTANVAGLQLADFLAHPARQQVLFEKGLIPEPGDVFGKKIWEILDKNKYRRHPYTGEIWGFGKKLLP